MTAKMAYAIPRTELMERAPSIFATEQKEGLSERYVFVPTVEIVDKMEENGWFPVKASEMRVRAEGKQGYQKHMVRFRNFEDRELRVGDTFVETVLTNSHDGCASFVFNVGLFRLVCSNGLTVSQQAFQSIRLPHSSYNLKSISDVTTQIAKDSPRIIERIQEFKETQLTPSEIEIFGDAAKRLRFDNPETVETNHVVRPNRQEDTIGNLWTVSNVIQENLIKGGIPYTTVSEKGQVKRQQTKKISSIASDIKLNMAIWSLTEEMLKIKKES